jgi:hypothetical protein
MEQKCVVAYIDVLGFRQMMLSEDPILRSNAIKLLVHLNSLSSKYGVSIDSLGLASMLTFNPELSTFSDNIVISVPIDVPCGEHPQGIEIFITNIISLIISSIWEGLHRGILFRGAVTIGRLYHQQNVVAGKGLLDAIDMEKDTNYPRIEVHKSVLDAVDGRGQPLVEDYTRQVSIKEQNGCYYINALAWHIGVWRDYFYFRNQPFDHKKMLSAVQAIKDLIMRNIEEFSVNLRESDSDTEKQIETRKKLEKWQWLKEEFENRQQDKEWLQIWSESSANKS